MPRTPRLFFLSSGISSSWNFKNMPSTVWRTTSRVPSISVPISRISVSLSSPANFVATTVLFAVINSSPGTIFTAAWAVANRNFLPVNPDAGIIKRIVSVFPSNLLTFSMGIPLSFIFSVGNSATFTWYMFPVSENMQSLSSVITGSTRTFSLSTVSWFLS